MNCLAEVEISRIILNKNVLIFLLNYSGKRASTFSSSVAMYSFINACRDKIKTTAFSLVILSVVGKDLRTPGRSSDLSTLI